MDRYLSDSDIVYIIKKGDKGMKYNIKQTKEIIYGSDIKLENVKTSQLLTELKRRLLSNMDNIERTTKLKNRLDSLIYEIPFDVKRYELENVSNRRSHEKKAWDYAKLNSLSSCRYKKVKFESFGYIFITEDSVEEAIKFFELLIKIKKNSKSSTVFYSDIQRGLLIWKDNEKSRSVKILTDRRSVSGQSSRLIGDYIALSNANIIALPILSKAPSYNPYFLRDVSTSFKKLGVSSNSIEWIGDTSRISRINILISDFLEELALDDNKAIASDEVISSRGYVDPLELELTSNRLASAEKKLLALYCYFRGFEDIYTEDVLDKILYNVLDIPIILQYNNSRMQSIRYLIRKIAEISNGEKREKLKREILAIEEREGNKYSSFFELRKEYQ